MPSLSKGALLHTCIAVAILAGLSPVIRFILLKYGSARQPGHKRSSTTVDYISSGLYCLAAAITVADASITATTASNNGLAAATRTELLYAAGVLYILGIWVLKSTFMAFYWRLFSGIRGKRNWLLYGAMLYTGAAALASILAMTLSCLRSANNGSKNWSSGTKTSRLPPIWSNSVCAALDIVGDFIVFAIPMIFIPFLTLPKWTKFSLVLSFIIGGMAIISSIVRTAIVFRTYTHQSSPGSSNEGALWSVLELFTGCIAFLAPSFRGLFSRLWMKASRVQGESSGVAFDRQSHSSGISPINGNHTDPEVGNLDVEKIGVESDLGKSETRAS